MSRRARPNRGFQFVNANPASQREKEENRAIVRTHASNYSWRQLGQEPTFEGSSHAEPTQPQVVVPSIGSAHEAVSVSNSHNRSHQPNDPSGTEDEDVANHLRNASMGPLSAVIARAGRSRSVEYNIQFDVLGCGSTDPFRTYPTELPSAVIGPLLLQVRDSLAQGLPHASCSTERATATIWFQTCASDRGLFHAMIFGQLSRNRSKDPTRTSSAHPILFSYSEAVRAVNRRMSDPSTACDDMNILAVLVLAFNGLNVTRKPRPVPCQGPLRTMQNLDIYGGALDPVAVHMDGLKHMLRLRGGLKGIKQPGLAHLLSYGCVVQASRNLKKPFLPYVALNPRIPDTLCTVRRPGSPFPRLGKGFQVLKTALPLEIGNSLYEVLLQLCDYTVAVHNYVEGSSRAQDLSILTDERNFVQHSLMSLEAHGQSSGPSQEQPLYEICRLAAIVYSLTVVFPIPTTTAPFTALGKHLKEVMSHEGVHAKWNETPHLMLWATVMAAIASIGSEDRSWFVCILDRLMSRLMIHTWSEMKLSLQEHLWFDGTNCVDGFRLWEEIERSSPFML